MDVLTDINMFTQQHTDKVTLRKMRKLAINCENSQTHNELNVCIENEVATLETKKDDYYDLLQKHRPQPAEWKSFIDEKSRKRELWAGASLATGIGVGIVALGITGPIGWITLAASSVIALACILKIIYDSCFAKQVSSGNASLFTSPQKQNIIIQPSLNEESPSLKRA